jgi:hypothetical protein
LSVALSNLIRKYKDKKHFDFCLLLSFLSAWLFISFSGFTELASLFSNKHLGLIEALLFTQIDLISFQRSGIEILPNNNWRSVSNDTFLSSFQHWYNSIYLALWFCLLRFLVSKDFNTLILDIDLTKLSREVLQLFTKLGVAIRSSFESFILHLKKSYDKSERKRTSVSNYAHAGNDAANTSANHIKPLMDGSKLDMEAHDIYSKRENEPQHKDCPFCCEEVLYRAIKCKHCGSELEPIPEPTQKKPFKVEQNLKKHNDPITWKHYVGISTVLALFMLFGSDNKKTHSIGKTSAEKLCKNYIGEMFNRPTYIIKTKHIKYDGGHFVKAFYNRPQDGDYFEYVCHLDNGTITYAGIFKGSGIGRWRYEDEMNYKKNKGGSWYLY